MHTSAKFFLGIPPPHWAPPPLCHNHYRQTQLTLPWSQRLSFNIIFFHLEICGAKRQPAQQPFPFLFQTLANGRKTAKSGKISSRGRGCPFLLTPSLLLPNFLAHPRRAPSLARFSFACSISSPPEKGKESAATQASLNFDEFKGKDCVFVADWLKTKGLHKLCSVFEGVEDRFTFIVCKYVLSNKPCLRAQLQLALEA